jgi:serine/threonine protein kinase
VLETGLKAEAVRSKLLQLLNGFSAGIGMCALLSMLLHRRQNSLTRSGADEASRTAAVGAASLTALRPDLAARRLIRKNSRQSVAEAYVLGPKLGHGSFGVVYPAVHRRTGVERAVKRIGKAGLTDAVLAREVEALRLTDHPNICHLIEYFETADHLELVTELCRGEDLFKHLSRVATAGGKVPEREARRLLGQMLQATLHCHRHCAVVHRDLKPENFVFHRRRSADEGHLKLVDFGCPAPISSAGPSSAFAGLMPHCPPAGTAPGDGAGTLLYMSPEMFSGRAPSQSDDVWSLGVIFHILLTGRFPFSTNVDSEFRELRARGGLERDVQECLRQLERSCSPAAANLAAQLLAFDPAKRVTVEAALQHPFLTSCGGGVQDTQHAAIATLSAEEVLRC